MDDKLAAEEARRAAKHGSLKAEVAGEVQAEIADHANHAPSPEEERKIDEVAENLRANAVAEVAGTEREVDRSRTAARVSQVLDYLFYILYVLLGIRLVLGALQARNSAGFMLLIVTVTDPFYQPFKEIVSSARTDDGFTLIWPLVVAIVAYILLHLAINAFLRMLSRRKTEI